MRKINATFLPSIFATCLLGLITALGALAQSHATQWWPDTVEAALSQSGTNRQELIQALEKSPPNQRDGLQFLITNMPPRDLQSLSSDYLLENLSLAYKARTESPWAEKIPMEIFFNDVLPYASVNEQRDNWRKQLREISKPLIKDAKSPGEAAIAINRQLFSLLKVKYSTARRAADQGPFETMKSGVATCTGLSILLVDACRSVGVPARVAGTPLWSNNSGNHTWVEVWDNGWHFTGAAEQDPNGLDRGWFVGNASQATQDDRHHAIYASSFKKTGTLFPLTWARRVDYVSAENVSDRYAAKAKPAEPIGTKLMVEVYDRPVGKRVATKVTFTDISNRSTKFEGISKGETADMNDHLFLQLPKPRTYLVEVEQDSSKIRQHFTTGTNVEDRLNLFLGGIPPVPIKPVICYAPPAVAKPLSPKDEAKLKETLTTYFSAPTNTQASFKFPGNLEKLLRMNEPAVRRVAWDAFRAAPIHSALRKDYESHQARFENHISPYTIKTVGTRPQNGWALFIAMHGGGNAPQELNDSQWRHMQIYYRDHPEVGGYIYVALRAPDNTWNGFYTSYIYPLIENLLAQFLLFGDVDPAKQFIMGYSHGGYGAFAIGPKIPDHFAAVHTSAAAIADGASPVTLRNTTFTAMVGGKDTAYGRYDRIREFKADIEKLRGDRSDIFPVTVQIVPDHPHSGLPDRDKIAEMYPNTRNPVPRELTWALTDGVVRNFFWLHTSDPGPGKRFDATCRDNRLTVSTSSNLLTCGILLDSRLVDFKKPVFLELNGKTTKLRPQPSLRVLCETLQCRADPDLAFTSEIQINTPAQPTKQ